VLVGLDERAHVLRRHQAHLVAELAQPARQMVGPARRLQADPRRRQVGQPPHQPGARQPAPGNHRAAPVHGHDVTHRLAKIDPDGFDLHGSSPAFGSSTKGPTRPRRGGPSRYPSSQRLPHEFETRSRLRLRAPAKPNEPKTRRIVRLFGPHGVRRTTGVLLLVRWLLAGGRGYRTAAAVTCSSTSSLTCADNTRPLQRGTRP
jgi:hypothetical protein